MNARPALLLVALALLAAIAALLTFDGGDVGRPDVEMVETDRPTDGGDAVSLASDAEVDAAPDRTPVADGPVPSEPDAVHGDAPSVADGPTWADVVAPFDVQSGAAIRSFSVEILTARDAEVERLEPQATLEDSVLEGEALIRLIAPGFTRRVFVTGDLAPHERPVPVPMRATTTVRFEIVGEVPVERPDLVVRMGIGSTSMRSATKWPLSWFDLDAVARPAEVSATDWSDIHDTTLSATWLDPTSAIATTDFESRFTLPADRTPEETTIEDVPVGTRLIVSVEPAAAFPPVDMALLREDGSIERMPQGTAREVRADGGTRVTLQFGGTATLRWSFDGRVGFAANSFKLFDESGRVTALDARQERRLERMDALGEDYDPSTETRTEFTARRIAPGRYTFLATWMPSRDGTSSCERTVVLTAGQTLDLGDLSADPTHTLTIVPRLVVEPGVPEAIATLVREELTWEIQAAPMDERRGTWEGHASPSVSGVGLNEAVQLGDLPKGVYFVAGQVDAADGPDLGGEYVVTAPFLSDHVIDGDSTLEIDFVLSATHEVVVALTNATPGRAQVRALAFLEGSDGQDFNVMIPLEAPRGREVDEDGRVELRGRLASGAWRILAFEVESSRLDGSSWRVATFRLVLGDEPPPIRQLELLDAVTAAIALDDRSSPTAGALRASPRMAIAPTGWPRMTAAVLMLDHQGEDELRYIGLLPHTEYTLLADDSTFLTGAPGSTVELVR